MSFLDLEKAKDICGMYWGSIGFWVCCYRPSGPCIAKWELCLHPWHKVKHVFRMLLVAPSILFALLIDRILRHCQVKMESNLGTAKLRFCRLCGSVVFILSMTFSPRTVCSWEWNSREESQLLQVWGHGCWKTEGSLSVGGKTARGKGFQVSWAHY